MAEPVLLALLGDTECGVRQATTLLQTTNTKVQPGEAQGSSHQGREVCDRQELAQNLTLDAILGRNITLTLGNSRISEMNLSNGSVFMVLQKPEALNQKDSSK